MTSSISYTIISIIKFISDFLPLSYTLFLLFSHSLSRLPLSNWIIHIDCFFCFNLSFTHSRTTILHPYAFRYSLQSHQLLLFLFCWAQPKASIHLPRYWTDRQIDYESSHCSLQPCFGLLVPSYLNKCKPVERMNERRKKKRELNNRTMGKA